MVNVVAATMGGVWALQLTGTPFQHLGRRGVHLDLRRRRPGRRALDLVFQPDARVGMPVREAVMRGAELRVRPVVMTSLTAALGLLPAAMANSIGSQAQKPLAIVVVGGISSALLLTLVPDSGTLQLFPRSAARIGKRWSCEKHHEFHDPSRAARGRARFKYRRTPIGTRPEPQSSSLATLLKSMSRAGDRD